MKIFGCGISILFVLGAFMALSIGIYDLEMETTYLLDLNAECAFPIMIGSATFLITVAGTSFIKDKNYEIKPPIDSPSVKAIGGICVYLSVFLLLQNGLGLNKEQYLLIFYYN